MADVAHIFEAIEKEALRKSAVESRLADARKALAAKNLEENALSFLLGVYQNVASKIQEQAHSRIFAIVSKCLTAVFEDPYEFEMLFESKRGKTEARIVFLRAGQVIEDPINAAGGGVIDVAAFALRLSSILLSNNGIRKVLILDEPFRYLSREYRPKVAQMLEEMAKGYGVQIIMVTHFSEFEIGEVVRL